MNHKKIVAALLLSTTLAGVGVTLPAHAAERVQQTQSPQMNNKDQVVAIPDSNLKRALNTVLGQSEGTDITISQLSKIKRLDLNNKNIHSIEGLQYCNNLEFLKIGFSQNCYENESNTISDLSPLAALTDKSHLTVVQAGKLQITDFSALQGFKLKFEILQSYLRSEVYKDVVPAEDGSYTLINPCKNIDGTPMQPTNTDGGTYDRTSNTITWTHEQILKHEQSSSGLPGNQARILRPNFSEDRIAVDFQLDVAMPTAGYAAGTAVESLFKNNDPTQWDLSNDVTQIKLDQVKAKIDALTDNDSFDYNGEFIHKKELSIWWKNADIMFSDQQNVLKLFKNNSESSNQLADGMTKDKITKIKEEVDQLHDGETKVHLESLVQQAFTLLKEQESIHQTFNIGGQGIGHDAAHKSGFARVALSVENHKATISKCSAYQFHWGGWKSSKYASIKLTGPDGGVIYEQSWRGNQGVSGKYGMLGSYDLPEGSTVEVYHAEGPWHRYSTSDNSVLKSKAGYTYTYKMNNNRLILETVK